MLYDSLNNLQSSFRQSEIHAFTLKGSKAVAKFVKKVQVLMHQIEKSQEREN